MRIGKESWCNEAWAKLQKARDEHADANPRTYRGREFTKTLALACPWCHSPFFVWQAVGVETEPFVDPSPISAPGMGQRYTCGHPICWEKEQTHQMKQTEAYKSTCDSYWNSKESRPEKSLKPKAKLTRLIED